MMDGTDIKTAGEGFLRGISKRRRQVLGKEDFSFFHVSWVPENLDPKEYEKRLRVLKQAGNFR